jgi:myo-inositol-1(or 4)-monophosphatase
MNYQKELAFAKEIAHQAGLIMLEHFQADSIGTIWKEDNTELTVADTAINTLVVKRVTEEFPDDGVLGEEESISVERERVWVCDPIDGTFPYSHGIPVSSFNLALVEDGLVKVAVIYDPFMKRLFHAIYGEGAYLNNKKLQILDSKKNRYGISLEVWGGSESTIFRDDVVHVRSRELLRSPSVLLIYHCSVAYTAALVAAGDLDGVIFSGKNPWDAAAASLIIQEAGGLFTDFFGEEQKYNNNIRGFIGAPPNQHGHLVAKMKELIISQGLS